MSRLGKFVRKLLSESPNVNAGRADKPGCIDEAMRCLAGGTIVKD
jgi:hypothetical protein